MKNTSGKILTNSIFTAENLVTFLARWQSKTAQTSKVSSMLMTIPFVHDNELMNRKTMSMGSLQFKML